MPGKKRKRSGNYTGSSTAGGSYKGRMRPIFGRVRPGPLIRRAKRRNLVRLINSVAMSKTETKYKSIAQSVTAPASGSNIFRHNTMNEIMKLWDNQGNGLFPAQGQTDGTRVGDSIDCTGIMVRGQFEVPYDRRDVHIDLYYIQFNSAVGGPDVSTFFHNVTGNALLDPVQNKRYTNVRKLGRYRCKPTDAIAHSTGSWLADNVVTKTIMFKKWLPMKKTVKFVADASTTPTNIPELGAIYAVVVDTLSTATSDIVVAASKVSATLYYKDP